MKNLFFVSVIFAIFFASCSKIIDPNFVQPQGPQELDPDIVAVAATNMQFLPGSIVRVGSIYIKNPTQYLQTSQRIYTFNLVFKNYEKVIDSVYWRVGNNNYFAGRDSIKSNFTFTVNQTLTSGQFSSPVEIFIKRSALKGNGEIVEVLGDKIIADVAGIRKTVTPYSQNSQKISFAVN